jgi:2-oxoglutarate ferredoxin oxidoreductase subunit alpha
MSGGEAAVRVGGAAGDGVLSTGEVFAKVCSRSNLHVYTYQSYQSVIRGGHSWFQIRVGNGPVLSQGDAYQILVALDQQTLDVHARGVSGGGAVIYDEGKAKIADEALQPGVRNLELPLTKTATADGGKAVMRNTVALGAVINLLDLDLRVLGELLEERFKKKGQDIVDLNVRKARAGYELGAKSGGSLGCGLRTEDRRRVLISGNHAIGLGAVAAGCKFYAAYPMTPASSILHYLAARASRLGMVVKQTEDELAAINMAIGASHAGVRAMTGTSGGGYSLMVEATGLAGMTETPVVIVDCQRVGPSTGLPTKTEQGDLNMLLGASQGDFPRIIIAPRNVRECFDSAWRAFNLADTYQTPVFLLMDLFLSEMVRSVDPEALDFEVPIIRGLRAEPPGKEFKRYAYAESGISPRSFPGDPGLIFVAGSDEHDEEGNLVSDVLAGIPAHVETRARMMEKRMRKQEGALKEMAPPELWGPAEADLTIVGFGSSQGAMREAADRINSNGGTVNTLEFRDLFPMRAEETAEILRGASRTLCVEGNYTGQLARLIRAETGIAMDHHYRKYDGEPFYPGEIEAKALEVLKGA